MQRHFDLRGSTCFKCCLSSTATCTSSRPNCHYMLGQVILESSLCSPRLFDLIISAFGFSVHPSRVWPLTPLGSDHKFLRTTTVYSEICPRLRVSIYQAISQQRRYFCLNQYRDHSFILMHTTKDIKYSW